MLAHLVGDPGGQPGPGVVHRHQDRGDAELGVQVGLDHLDGLEQLAEPLERVVLRLDRDHHLLAGHERVEREQSQGGRAVDEDVVEALLAGLRGGADRGWPWIALRSRLSRATTLTSSISAPARSIVAGTTQRPGTSGQAATTSASGCPSTSTS